MTLSKDLIAASTTQMILSILRRGDSYGYAIIQQVHALSDGDMAWEDGMLYPILHRLESRKWIKSYWGEADNGRKRKYYRLLKAGEKELDEQRKNWSSVSAMLQKAAAGA